MKDSEIFLTSLYNSFNPFQPLNAGDPKYVDCRKVRGNDDIKQDLGVRIRRSQRTTYHLYSGHRGAGKSTELLRLKKYLEERNFYVVYFAADEEDIQSEDAQYTDILLACTRHLLEELNRSANPNPLLGWVKQRIQELKDLARTEIFLEGVDVEAQIAQVAKLTANLRAEPSMRQKIREKVNPHTVSLIEILNQFLREAKQNLPNNCTDLAVIVDNLDRIVPIVQESGRTNHEEIFIDRSEQLQALECHIIYTVPISLIYSERGTDTRDIYSDTLVLPMVMVRTPDGNVYQPGIKKIEEVIKKRVNLFAPNFSLSTEIFDSPETLKQLCLMSGGHVRNLLLLMQEAISRTEELPISKRAVKVAISRARDAFRRTVNHDQWHLLTKVYFSKRIVNNDEYRNLLFKRCVLEYCYWDDQDEMQRWYDIHPLIKGIPEFIEAVANTKS